MPTQAFKVQRGTTVISSGSASATITAGTEYTAPAAITKAFIRLASSRHTGMGDTVGGGNQNLDDTTVRITNPGNLLTGITFTRAGTANPCRVSWEIVEYVGADGGDNEFIVRDQATVTASTGTTMTGSTVTNIGAIGDACLWLTSQSTAETGRADFHECLWTGELAANASNWDPTFTKLAASLNNSAWVSYAVIEFTGANWRSVQRIETTAASSSWTSADNPGAGYTVGIPTTLLDTGKAFVHVQYATSNDPTGLDDAGDNATIDSTTNLRLWSRATTGTRRKVVWLMENVQSDATARNLTVQRHNYYQDAGGSEERTTNRAITAVDATEQTSACLTVSCDGTGTAFPRGCVDITALTTTNLEMRTSDAGQEYQYAIEVIEWPEDPDAGGSDDLLADDVESASEVTSPSIGQTHALTSTDVESASEVSVPAIGKAHALNAFDIKSATEVSAPALAETHALTADSVESGSEVSSPAIGQAHALLSDDPESATEVSTPAVGQVHGLGADSVESGSEVSLPSLSESHILAALDVESSTEVNLPALGQVHALLVDSVESLSELSQPSLGQDAQLLADDVESATEVSTPALGQEHALSAVSVEAQTELTTPALTEQSTVDALLAEDVESASAVTSPVIGQSHALLSVDLGSLSEVSVPALMQVHALTAVSLESASELTLPSLSEGEHSLSAVSVESQAEVSVPVLTQLHVLLADSVESRGEATYPSLNRPQVFGVEAGNTFHDTFS